MRVIVTRPQDEARRWVLALEQQGIAALSLPLIDIEPLSDTRPMAAAWQTALLSDAVMFVSTPAVDHFFAVRPYGTDFSAPASMPRFWAPGPGTVAALVRNGVAPQRIDAPAPDGGQFDSEALWQRVAAQVRPGWQVLVVRGAAHDMPATTPASDGPGDGSTGAQGQGREWLADQLRRAGAQVRFVVTYRRAPPDQRRLQQGLADNGIGHDDLWLFTSAQAIGHLCASLPTQDWSAARAMATHPRIALAARAAGFGVVKRSRPAFHDIAASIKSLR